MEPNYIDLFDKVGEQEFKRRFEELSKLIETFIQEAGYKDTVICNNRILYHVLLDYYSDILRLKDFHEIIHTKTDKVIAYLIYWIVRRMPIQSPEFSIEEKDIFINERFACSLLISECLLKDCNINLDSSSAEKFDKYIDLLMYYFKYRQLNPQVIELVIESIKIGKMFGTV